MSVRFENAPCRKNDFKDSYTVECGNRLRVGVRASNASVSGVCVSGPSKVVGCRRCSIRADFGEGDGTKHFSVKKKGFSVKRGEAIQ